MRDVQVGDVWEYKGTGVRAKVRQKLFTGEWSLARSDGQHGLEYDESILAHMTPISRAGQPVTAACTESDCKIAIPHDHASFVAPVTAGEDRSGCKAWCGLPYESTDVPSRAFIVSRREGGKHGDPVWCSARCRDLRLPPMEEGARTGAPVADDHRRIVNMDACPACVGLTVRHVTECTKRIREIQLLERTPSTVASAPERVRDTFTDLCDDWDLLPSVND